MEKIYSEENVTWSSVENKISYDKVIWYVRKNGIPVCMFFNEDNKQNEMNND